LKHGGWCPPGRTAEDGIIPEKYRLKETSFDRSMHALKIPRSLRTERNVKEADGTLILNLHQPPYDEGTDWTIKASALYRKSILVVNPEDEKNSFQTIAWLKLNNIKILNIAGPAESIQPGIQRISYVFLNYLLAQYKELNFKGL
jgi:hypothetical protein